MLCWISRYCQESSTARVHVLLLLEICSSSFHNKLHQLSNTVVNSLYPWINIIIPELGGGGGLAVRNNYLPLSIQLLCLSLDICKDPTGINYSLYKLTQTENINNERLTGTQVFVNSANWYSKIIHRFTMPMGLNPSKIKHSWILP